MYKSLEDAKKGEEPVHSIYICVYYPWYFRDTKYFVKSKERES